MPAECPVSAGAMMIDIRTHRLNGKAHSALIYTGHDTALKRGVTPLNPKRSFAVVTDLPTVLKVAGNTRLFTSETDGSLPFTGADLGGKVGTLGTDNFAHTRLAKNAGFNQEQVRAEAPVAREIARKVIASFRPQNGQIDFISDFAELFANEWLSYRFGLSHDKGLWNKWKTAAGIAFGPVPDQTAIKTAKAQWEKSDALMQEVLRGKNGLRGNSYENGVIFLASRAFDDRYKAGDKQFDEHAKTRTLDTAFHGAPAFLPVLVRAGILLFQRPYEKQKWVNHPEEGSNIVGSLLMDPAPAHFPVLAQRAVGVDEVELGGQKLVRGELIMASLTGAIQDLTGNVNEVTSDFPDIAIKSRLAFGHGPHYCSGAEDTIVGVGEGLGELVNTYPNIKLAGSFSFGGGALAQPYPYELPVDLGKRAR